MSGIDWKMKKLCMHLSGHYDKERKTEKTHLKKQFIKLFFSKLLGKNMKTIVNREVIYDIF